MAGLAVTRILLGVDITHAEGHPPSYRHVAATVVRRTAGCVLNDRSGHQVPAAWGQRPMVSAIDGFEQEPAPMAAAIIDALDLSRDAGSTSAFIRELGARLIEAADDIDTEDAP